MSYFIDGVIQSGSLVSLIDSNYNLLTYNDGTYSYSNAKDGTISSYYSVLQVIIDSYKDNNIYVYFKYGNSYVYPNGTTFQSSDSKPAQITLTQTTFQPQGRVAFPGTLYTVYDVNNNPLPAPIYLVPSIWYASPCKKASESSLALQYHVQWMESGIRPAIGYTNKKQCKRGFDYQLCTYGTNCQTTCMGPCLDANETCELLRTEFVCTRGVDEWFTTKMFYITIGVIFFVLAIAVMIVIFPRLSNDWLRKSKTTRHTSPGIGKPDDSSQSNPK